MGFKIVKTERLNSVTNLFEIDAPLLAKSLKAGQFIVLRIGDTGERIPLTVAKKDPKKGLITIIFQEAGKTTNELSTLKEGCYIIDIVGPLGKPTDFGKAGKVIIVGGGVGIAEILPVTDYAKACGNDVTVIMGARTKELLLLEEELGELTDKLIVTTDDGSHKRRGLVTEPLLELLKNDTYGLVYCVGPDCMMKAVCALTKEVGVKTLVSLDANMVDGTGMCGSCRVTVGGKTKFTCVDGPEFDGHQVDWDEFLKRQKRFIIEEERSMEFHNSKCACKK